MFRGDSILRLRAVAAAAVLCSTAALEEGESRGGENLAQPSEQTGNRWTPPYTALINAFAEDQTLEAGTLVKIVRRELYRP